MILIFEGLDRCGKDTQIKLVKQNIKRKVFHELHYTNDFIKNDNSEIAEIKSYFQYGEMFKIINFFIENKMNLILNRSHLGEHVYSEKYRNYDGSYVFDLEKMFIDKIKNKIFLVIFIDTPENILNREDGNSLSKDIENKKYEIEKFKEAFEKTIIPNKIIININNKSIEEIHKEIMKFLNNE